MRRRSKPLSREVACEALEMRRLFSTIVWLNRGTSSNDSVLFNSVFGTKAALARSVVDAAIQSWENVISSFNYPANSGVTEYFVTIEMAGSGTGQGASTNITHVTSNNLPYQSIITIFGAGTDGSGGGYYPQRRSLRLHRLQLPQATNSARPTRLSGSTLSSTSPAKGQADFYSIVTHELGHAMGIYASNPDFKALATDTGVVDTTSPSIAGTSNAGDWWASSKVRC